MKTQKKMSLRHWAYAAAVAVAGLPLISCGTGSVAVYSRAQPHAYYPAAEYGEPVQFAQATPQPIYVPAQSPSPAPVVATPSLDANQLNDLTSSIALYPDPLLAVMLPAATYPDQIASANNWLARNPTPSQNQIDVLPFDQSVKELMHYPTALSMMAQNPDWTQALGMAFVYQQPQLMDAIQSWRSTALADNTLFSTPQIQVVNVGGQIEILPAAPDQIYVPAYDPAVVYAYHPRHEDVLQFGPVAFSGHFLDHVLDWGHHEVRRPERVVINEHNDRGDHNERGGEQARVENHVFSRQNFQQNHYPARIETPEHHVITPTARGPSDHHGQDHATANEGHNGDHGQGNRQGDQHQDHTGEANNR